MKKAAAVQELRGDYRLEEKEGKIVILHNLIEMLPEAFLLNLGSEKEVKNAKKPNSPRKFYATLEQNLLSAVLAAFPTCTVKEHEKQHAIGGKRFKGLYIDGLCSSNG